ncbi:hypothetical protein ABFS82_07G111400 [Erythranthe guttata]|uniref:Uncharacterized protein n=1 Tax=Erythranthe guttata TaxID=4155 RepID=A0A022R3R0_ERYGU|nr:PREDICTED: uncharacterized protein LOC105961460 [Erythranthe guttata]EYU34243.1 hypothetical protein MIMGU_mgv1a016808mg [Erythranthe guttata]|eukprot:XP_012841145.1 PREDICTED: uncharacterized protein LOC105961460 [Erythranthe guttata]
MEGLIPMMYKSLKKSKTRRNYECLSTGAAQAYNISDFYVREGDHYVIAGPDKVPGLGGPPHHRRYNSVHVAGGGAARGFEEEEEAAKSKQLVRFRSHRMFSCVTGA